jgi:TonB family protein
MSRRLPGALGFALAIAAGMASAAPWPNTRDVTVSEARPTSSGSWNYTLRRSSHAWSCDEKQAGGKLCLEHILTVSNDSAETLVCQVRVDFQRADGSSAGNFTAPVLVLPRTRPDVHTAVTDDQTQASVTSLDCLARAAYKRVAKAPGCKYDMMGKPFETYYPAEAKLRSLQGPVIVSFRLEQKLGPARDVAVAESSLVPLLDDAALKFIRDQDFRTNCPGQRYDVLMRFKLRNEVLAQAGQ